MLAGMKSRQERELFSTSLEALRAKSEHQSMHSHQRVLQAPAHAKQAAVSSNICWKQGQD